MTDQPMLFVPAHEGNPYQGVGGLFCKVPSSTTDDAFTVLELRLQPGQGAPMHRHQNEDELMYVQSGACIVGQIDQEWFAETGSMVHFPKGTAHFFQNTGTQPCVLLITAIPGGLDRYFAAISEAAAHDRPEQVAEINQQYGISFITPEDTATASA